MCTQDLKPIPIFRGQVWDKGYTFSWILLQICTHFAFFKGCIANQVQKILIHPKKMWVHKGYFLYQMGLIYVYRLHVKNLTIWVACLSPPLPSPPPPPLPRTAHLPAGPNIGSKHSPSKSLHPAEALMICIGAVGLLYVFSWTSPLNTGHDLS